ncbi:hypothetical protein [Reinekea sp.]|jgi:hypothetical protein|uniref:hypothetical protein n=1 Tax=Reinekea sp. TaxID=1970455 RepID=UPI0039892D1F
MNSKYIGCALASCLLTASELADAGWSVGLGVVTSDIYQNSTDDQPIFPTLDIDSKQAMFIPDVSYHWDQWSIGATGLSWKSKQESELKSAFTLGFPRSDIRIGGQQGWFRYGVYGAAQFTNGTMLNGGINLGPMSYEQFQGLASRKAEQKQVLSLAAPVFISKKYALTVIGKLSYAVNNAEFKAQDLRLTSDLPSGTYENVSANLFAIKKIGESVTWINSGTFTFADEQQLNLVDGLKPVHFNLFSLIQYTF